MLATTSLVIKRIAVKRSPFKVVSAVRHRQVFQSHAVCGAYFSLQRHFLELLNRTPPSNFLSTDSICVMAADNGGSWLGCGDFAMEWYSTCELADRSKSPWIP